MLASYLLPLTLSSHTCHHRLHSIQNTSGDAQMYFDI